MYRIFGYYIIMVCATGATENKVFCFIEGEENILYIYNTSTLKENKPTTKKQEKKSYLNMERNGQDK